MAHSKFTGLGYIIATRFIEGGSNGFEISVSVPTGDRKEDGQQYAPSNLVKATFWGKQADAVSQILEKGQRVLVEGNMSVPYVYEKDGELKCTMQLSYPKVDVVKYLDEESSENTVVAERATKTASNKAKSKKQTKAVDVFEDNDDDDLDDDIFS